MILKWWRARKAAERKRLEDWESLYAAHLKANPPMPVDQMIAEYLAYKNPAAPRSSSRGSFPYGGFDQGDGSA